VIGTAELVDVVGPLTRADLVANATKLNQPPRELDQPLYYDKTYAWVLRHARRLPKPVPYTHPSGAVIWVKLGADVVQRLG
jgi:hypothetical protein